MHGFCVTCENSDTCEMPRSLNFTQLGSLRKLPAALHGSDNRWVLRGGTLLRCCFPICSSLVAEGQGMTRTLALLGSKLRPSMSDVWQGYERRCEVFSWKYVQCVYRIGMCALNARVADTHSVSFVGCVVLALFTCNNSDKVRNFQLLVTCAGHI